MAIRDCYFRGGAYTLDGVGTAASDGDWNEDDSGGGSGSNWVNASGAPIAKPVSGDRIHLTEMARRVPASYTGAGYPHVIGDHWSVSANLDQGAVWLTEFNLTENFTGHIYGLNSDTINNSGTAVDKLDGTVGIPITGHPFNAGDYVTIANTDYYDGEHRVVSETANEIVIEIDYVAETFSGTDTVTGKTPLRIGMNVGAQAVIKGNRTYYIECGDDTPDVPNLYFDSTSGYLHLSSQTVGADFTSVLVVGSGTIVFADDCCVGTLTTTGDCTATVIGGKSIKSESGLTPSTLDIYGGTITWDSKAGTITMGGGTFNYCPNVSIGVDVDIDSFVGYAGTFNWYGKSIMTAYVNYGTNVTALGDGTKTFGSAATSYKHYGGILDLSQPTGFVSLYSGADIDLQGGSFYPPKRQNISW